MTRASILPLAAASIVAATVLSAGGALADHKGPGSVHVGAGIEFGPRLSARLETSVAESVHARPQLSEATATAQAAAPQPKRNVRVVYPGPYSN